MSNPAPLLHLTTSQLQYLVTINRTATLAEAAEELQISASALSQGLTELERRTGLELFERQGRNRVLNGQGQEAVTHAERILSGVRDMSLWARSAATGEVGQVRLGMIDIAAVNYFPGTLLDFRAARPDVELHLTVAPSATLVAGLLEGRLDAAVIVDPPGSTAGPGTDGSPIDGQDGPQADDAESVIVMDELLTEELAIYAPAVEGPSGPGPKGRRSAAGPPSSWGPWVTFPRDSHTRRHVATALRELGAEFVVEAESNQPDVLRQMVNLGMGWTVLPVLQAETEPNPLVRARRKPLLTRRLMIARRRTASGRAVIDLIERLRLAA